VVFFVTANTPLVLSLSKGARGQYSSVGGEPVELQAQDERDFGSVLY